DHASVRHPCHSDVARIPAGSGSGPADGRDPAAAARSPGRTLWARDVTSGSLSRYEQPEPRAGQAPVSERSRGVAVGLAVLGGPFGLHRFYTGRIQSGIWMCLTLGWMGIWYLLHAVLVAAADVRDRDARRGAPW